MPNEHFKTHAELICRFVDTATDFKDRLTAARDRALGARQGGRFYRQVYPFYAALDLTTSHVASQASECAHKMGEILGSFKCKGDDVYGKDHVAPLLAWMACYADEKDVRASYDSVRQFYVEHGLESELLDFSFRRWEGEVPTFNENWLVDPTPKLYAARAQAAEIENIKDQLNQVRGRQWTPPLVFPAPIPRDDTDNRNWLSPLNPFDIKFADRPNEFRQLTEFVKARAAFQIWTVIAPSGAGKTRMAVEWMRTTKELSGWQRGILRSTNPTGWSHWFPDRPTLIVIDYLFMYRHVLKEIFERIDQLDSAQRDYPPVRVLILDHIFPARFEDLPNDPNWGLIFKSRFDVDRAQKWFFRYEPIRLDLAADHGDVLASIISTVSGEPRESPKVEAGISYLDATKGARQPLFAALIGRAILNGEEYARANRRQLIDSYLSGATRLPWRNGGAQSGLWAGCMVAAATVRQGSGSSFSDLCKALPSEPASGSTDLSGMIDTCRRIVSSPSATVLPPFYPDLLGETFLLKLLSRENRLNRKLVPALTAMIASWSDEEEERDGAIQIAGFFERLNRNVSMDDQIAREFPNLDPGVDEFWEAIEAILDARPFKKGSPTRWAIAVAALSAAIGRRVNGREFRSQLDKISLDDLTSTFDLPSEEYAALASVIFLELTGLSGDAQQGAIDKVVSASLRPATIREMNCTPIHIAAFTGMTFAVRTLIRSGADVNIKSRVGVTPLMAAAYNGSTPVVRLLLQAGAELDAAQQESGATAILMAANRGHAETVRVLAEAGASINAQPAAHESTPLIEAIGNGRLETVKCLIAVGADVNLPQGKGETPLIWAARVGNLEFVNLLLEAGAKLDFSPNREGGVALHLAAFLGHSHVVQRLVDAGANIDAKMTDGKNALQIAAGGGKLECLNILLRAGANLEECSVAGVTALLGAARYGHIAAAEMLLEAGANVDAMHSDRLGTALHVASAWGQTQTANLLLQAGADVNAKAPEFGATPLMFATGGGHYETMNVLIAAGADVNATQKGDGVTILMQAAFRGNAGAVRILIKAGADVNAVAINRFNTALTMAANAGSLDCVRELVAAGADLEYELVDGRTALSTASRNAHAEIMQLLRDAGAKK